MVNKTKDAYLLLTHEVPTLLLVDALTCCTPAFVILGAISEETWTLSAADTSADVSSAGTAVETPRIVAIAKPRSCHFQGCRAKDEHDEEAMLEAFLVILKLIGLSSFLSTIW